MLNTLIENFKKIVEKIKEKFLENKLMFVFYVVIVIALIAFIINLIGKSSIYKDYDVLRDISKEDNVSVNYEMMGKGFMRYSKNGLAYTDAEGTVLWNQGFEMVDGKAVKSGEYFAVGNIGGNEVRVFNLEGQVGVINLPMPLLDLKVANQGVVAVVLRNSSNQYQINLYDKQGKDLVNITTSVAETGYPLSMLLSEDGSRLFVSYISVKDGEINNEVLYYDFSDETKNDREKVKGSITFNELSPKMELLDDNHIAIFLESEVVVVKVSDSLTEKARVSFTEEIKTVFSSEDKIGVVLKNSSEGAKYQLKTYDINGKNTMSVDLDIEYEHINASENDIIIYNDYECLIYDYKGKEKFNYEFENKILNMIPGIYKNHYILVDEQKIQEIKIK